MRAAQGASKVQATLSNQQTYMATVVGDDRSNDVAVLKLASVPADVRPIAVGTSHDLLVGQRVFAIGNPFGLDQTLTAGIVSSVNRQIQGIARRVIRDVIQTDAAINPGNSGGPLLDSSGRLIGVNTMIYSPSGGNVGIGFAVPVNTVRRSVAQIVATGRVRRGRVGLRLLGDEPSSHIRQALQLPPGVIVAAVEPGSGAAQAGIRCACLTDVAHHVHLHHIVTSACCAACTTLLAAFAEGVSGFMHSMAPLISAAHCASLHERVHTDRHDCSTTRRALTCRGSGMNAAGEPVPGDLIVAVGGERVQSSEDVLAIVEQFSVGDQVPITLQRGSQQIQVNAPVVEMPE